MGYPIRYSIGFHRILHGISHRIPKDSILYPAGYPIGIHRGVTGFL